MNDNSYNDWASMSDKALGAIIGNFIKHHRLNQNKTHDEGYFLIATELDK